MGVGLGILRLVSSAGLGREGVSRCLRCVCGWSDEGMISGDYGLKLRVRILCQIYIDYAISHTAI